jgi:hypothetical protein
MRATLPLVVAVTLTACSPATQGPDPLDCDDAWADVAAPTSEEELHAIFTDARVRFFPELAPYVLRLDLDISSADAFFIAQPDLSTIEEPPRDRLYVVRGNPTLLDDPPSATAVGAILVHELKHIRDYTEMDTDELVNFGLWYGIAEDVSEYERETDEHALRKGCAEGIKAYRAWLYEHIPEESVAAKREDYFTPEEVDAWVADNG